MIEMLETRRLLSVSVLIKNKVLKVDGDNAANTIDITLSGNKIAVNGKTKTSDGLTDLLLTSITKISVQGLDGNDTITVAPGVTKPTTLDGGFGADSVKGGGGKDLIVAGASAKQSRVTLSAVQNGDVFSLTAKDVNAKAIVTISFKAVNTLAPAVATGLAAAWNNNASAKALGNASAIGSAFLVSPLSSGKTFVLSASKKQASGATKVLTVTVPSIFASSGDSYNLTNGGADTIEVLGGDGSDKLYVEKRRNKRGETPFQHSVVKIQNKTTSIINIFGASPTDKRGTTVVGADTVAVVGGAGSDTVHADGSMDTLCKVTLYGKGVDRLIFDSDFDSSLAGTSTLVAPA